MPRQAHQQGLHRRAAVSRATTAKAIGAGVAGLTATFALAPLAHADSGPAMPTSPMSTSSAAPAPAPAGASVGPAAKGAPTPAVTTTDTAPVTPDYGYQKFRVGVQVKDGAYPQAATAGTRFDIVETGPNADNGLGSTTCDTVADTGSDATKTFCATAQSYRRSAVRPAVAPASNLEYTIQPGDTVTVTQSTVVAGLVKDPKTVTIGPCDAGNGPFCADSDDNTLSTDAIFTDTGIPPVAVNDDAGTVKVGNGPVDIDVLGNDTAHAPVTDLQVTTDPQHGTAVVKQPLHPATAAATNPGATTIVYTPDVGYTGTDTFRYTLTTANGTASARVTITVVAPVATTTPTPTPTATSPSSTVPIANTGVANGDLLEIALGLLAAGAAAGVAGRRVHRGRHSA